MKNRNYHTLTNAIYLGILAVLVFAALVVTGHLSPETLLNLLR